MGHCLTQPEEIDHILMSMAGDDMEVDAPTPDGVQPSRAILDVECEGSAMAPGYSYGDMHKKSAQGLSNP